MRTPGLALLKYRLRGGVSHGAMIASYRGTLNLHRLMIEALRQRVRDLDRDIEEARL